ncbi:penicillin-binding protein 1A [Flavisolibacter tropicus]|uniref:Peptidoglycan glycosyltransferase n=1 Tax=Flavisolibacter tropicus TaxID=1492898 RepID=A0A172TTB3_9BACT|nr:transglycosylase domain-containing protein [Flavisolibacter tropicus]ANE50188.1 peptidoglycan glycosyltransferase [Flavisolibacter tropicus]
MKKSVRIFWIVFFTGFGIFVMVILLAMMGAFGKMPSLRQLENPSLLQSSEVYASDGTLMGKYYLEKGNRSNVDYKDISKHVIDALIATEDERFYDHSGVDVKSTLRAVVLLGKEGGGSTITQQLAKNLFNGEGASNALERGIQKIKEYIIAIRLERNFTKQEILALYLNAVPFGNNIYGIRNAAKSYFQKEPDRLNPEEAALLVGMLKGNTLYNPLRNPVAARDRRNVVLGQMEKNGFLTAAKLEQLKALPVKINYKKMDENTGYAPYFREVLRDELKNILKDLERPDGEPYDIYDDGLKIYTTINPRMQEYAEEAVAQQMPLLQKSLNTQRNIKTGNVWKGHDNVLEASMRASDRWRFLKDEGLSDAEIKKTFYQKVPMKIFAWTAKREKDTVMTPMDSIKYHRQMLQTSFMVMDPVTGEVKAWVGGIDFKTYKYDHANLKTKRQVGSTIKPLLYAQAMEERGFTMESEVLDQQQDFGGGRLVPATSKTCSGRSMSMASALAWSKNCATAYIMKQVGPAQFANFLERINIPTKVEPHPSIALGSCDLSLYEMMWGYSIFAGRGFSTKPYFISRIEDRNGNVIKRFDYSTNRKEVISEVTAYNMCKMMEGPVTKGTAAGLMYRLGATEMGGKTGTTNDNADAWFMGYTPQLLAGTWIGCDDRFIRIESNSGMGGQAARPIWEAFFKKVYADKSLGISKEATFPKPADLDNKMIDADPASIIEDNLENAEGNDFGVGNANDYSLDESYDSIGAESKRPVDDNNNAIKPTTKPKKDSSTQKTPKIGEMNTEEKKEKKGFLKGIFGGKKNKENKQSNEY